jgi:predicted nucleic acid-binding protein
MQSAELPLFFSPLGELELINALQLRLFRKEMLSVQVRRAQAAFRADVANGVLAMIPLPEDIYAQSARLASAWTAKFGTRSLDIIQVASAVAMKADTFYTFDGRQRRLAGAVGLRIL